MADVAHIWGGDLQIGSTGDVAVVSDAVLGQQRVLRRLLTNPGDYLWQLSYGAGLAAMIGQPANAARISALIRSQIFQEAAVAPTPLPVIDIQAIPQDTAGSLYVTIMYTDASSGATQLLSFTA